MGQTKKFFNARLLALALIVLVAGSLAAPSTAMAARSSKDTQKADQIKEYVEKHFYFREDIDWDAMTKAFEKGSDAGKFKRMIKTLNDDYSEYMTKKEYKRYKEDTYGEFGGIGATLKKVKNGVRVTEVMEKSPAKRIGIKKGFVILSVDGKKLKGKSLDYAVRRIRGKKGTRVSLEVKDKKGNKKTYDTIREEIHTKTISFEMADKDTGYIDLIEFTSNTPDELREAYGILSEKGMKNLVIDLRSNGGGSLWDACEAADDLSDYYGVTCTLKKFAKNKSYYPASEEKAIDCPIVVMTSKDTASAAEAFTGIL